jgi:methyltransferase (TIGR00027 family)
MKEDSPSATAYLIARNTVFPSRDPLASSLVPGDAAELSCRFIRGRRRLSRWLDRITNFQPLAAMLERATIPGIKLHYALRKRYLEEAAREAITNGFRQVVVIGAGFDTLALRLHESFPDVYFVEIDHPATQLAKTRVVGREVARRGNLRFIPLDLAHTSLDQTLLSHPAYRPDSRTFYIAEGLLMYLTQQEVDHLFKSIGRHSGSRFAFTFMNMQADGRIGFTKSSRVVDAWLKLRGERFKWGIDPSQIDGFLAARTFKTISVATSDSLRAKYLAATVLQHRALADGECICVAECA